MRRSYWWTLALLTLLCAAGLLSSSAGRAHPPAAALRPAGGPTATPTATAPASSPPAPASSSPPATVPAPASSSPTATATVCGVPFIVTDAITAGDLSASDRLNRNGVPSTCATPQTCPGSVGGAGPYHYDSYALTNSSGAPVCVTVAFTTGCPLSIESAAYLGSFDPANPCTNYLADLGDSPPSQNQYSFTVPAGAAFVIVINEVQANLGCASYTMTVSGLNACLTPTPTVTNTATATATATVTQTATATVTQTATATVT